ncbi:uncharacterized protein A1O9_12791 [Exophiala aquamarina CBS 119918]|uniref:Carboxylic ester hydrolase n=1 Tax=Exophiala aquamarina CBS 119918 TaxID=1182545 RepID=A0A072NUV7_9EURO|nr:uncharacterized protein A1O9_12791 [Exophiala aquamarina CBS 119918]KEF51177.1 hypothetical protein A1O9_12791 [Exophiala aquamarina CBS 119918]
MRLQLSIYVTVLLGTGTFANPNKNTGSGVKSCASLSVPNIPGATVISLKARELRNYTVSAAPLLLSSDISGINVCDVDIVLAHPNAQDQVNIKMWLPLDGWNGRFLGTGGSGYAAGLFEYSLAPALALGYASASTDAGLSGDPYSPALWALKADGQVNFELLTNFASRSVHDMAVVGKQIATQFYGTKPHHSYWNGCSTGGRQGLISAQKYPADFDGIVAGAPAIDWARYVVAEQWPQVVMKEQQTYVSPCVLKAFTQSAISACDSLDEVKDNVITDPTKCNFSPYSLVGTKIVCDGSSVNFTTQIAKAIHDILEGPFPNDPSRSYTLNLGAPLDSLANTTLVNGTQVGLPFFVNDAWLKYFVVKDPEFDTTTIGYSDFKKLFSQSQKEYGAIIASDDPNFSRFRTHGGKLIVWHGLSDQLIFPSDTVNYHRRVESALRDRSSMDQFYRTFLAPGVDHCGLGTTQGAVPVDPLSSLVAWVEEKKAPEILEARTLNASGATITRSICKYPLKSQYTGHGDKNLAANYVCV